MKRWLAWELAKNDKSLSGFWPLSENLNDYSGNYYHLLSDVVEVMSHVGGKRASRAVASNPFYHKSPYEAYTNNTGALNCWFNPEESFTISGWIYPESYNDSILAICAKATDDGSWQGWRLKANASHSSHPSFTAALEFVFSYNYGNDIYYINYTPSTMSYLKPFRWYHIAMVWDGSAGIANAKINFYVNGIEYGVVNPVQPGTGSFNWLANSRMPVMSVGGTNIAVSENSSNPYSMRCLRVYKRKVPHTELVNIMNRESLIERFPNEGANALGALYVFSTNNYVPLCLNTAQPPEISGGGPSESIPLYIAKIPSFSDSFTLFINGADNATGTIPLFIQGNPQASGDIPLFISGPTPASSVPPEMFLYIGLGTPFSGDFPLVIQGPTSGTISSNMNMFIEGGTTPVDASMDIVLWNGESGAISTMPLVMAGPSGADGYLPTDSNINLFITTSPADEEHIPLYIAGGGTPTGTMPLVIEGGQDVTGSVNLVIGNVVGQVSGETLTLYTHGF